MKYLRFSTTERSTSDKTPNFSLLYPKRQNSSAISVERIWTSLASRMANSHCWKIPAKQNNTTSCTPAKSSKRMGEMFLESNCSRIVAKASFLGSNVLHPMLILRKLEKIFWNMIYAQESSKFPHQTLTKFINSKAWKKEIRWLSSSIPKQPISNGTKMTHWLEQFTSQDPTWVCISFPSSPCRPGTKKSNSSEWSLHCQYLLISTVLIKVQ